MMNPIKIASSAILSLSLGAFVSIALAVRQFTCSFPDGTTIELYGGLLPYRTEFDITAAETPVLWLMPFLINILPAAALAWLLFGRQALRGGARDSGLKSGLFYLLFSAALVWFTYMGLRGYDIETMGLGPDRVDAVCETIFGLFVGTPSSYSF